jgi:GT2 family glycosyltransferase
MPIVARLSIVIPMLGNAELMEAGLVSVLEHRPLGCEVLLVLNGEYGNPYGLEDEVRFVTAPKGAGWAESCNLGIEQATTEIVHLLMPGVEVTPGWADKPVRRFTDGQVAAVSPLVLDPQRRQRITAAGVSFRIGRRLVSGTYHEEHKTAKLPRVRVLGPSCLAGFYRKAHLVALGGIEPRLGDDLADIDLGLRMHQVGLRTVVEPQSVVLATQPKRSPCGFRRGLHTERLLLRNSSSLGRLTMVRPPAMLLGLAWRLVHPLRAAAHCLGQLAAWCELPRHCRFRSSREQTLERIDACETASHANHVRMDAACGPSNRRGRKSVRVA